MLVENGIALSIEHVVKSYASTHPYLNNTDETWLVAINGASQIRIEFDLKTATESGYDYLQFLKGSSADGHWGAEKYSGGGAWPGVGETPGLFIESDRFLIWFYILRQIK